MHSSESAPAQQPAAGADLLRQVGRLIVRSRSPAPDARHRTKALPSTSQEVLSQQCQPSQAAVEERLERHLHDLWNDHVPICVEVLLGPECPSCLRLSKDNESKDSGLLLERWTMSVAMKKTQEPSFSSSQWLLNAVRSQLHFSQLSAWLARLTRDGVRNTSVEERRRKLSRESCNYKKLESNCEADELPNTMTLKDETPKLNIIYSIKTVPGDSYTENEFSRQPVDHTFPITDIGNNTHLKILLQSLPRTEIIPSVKCKCMTQPKRRLSNDEITSKMLDLTLGPSEFKCKRSHDSRMINFKTQKVVDDRMHTNCMENGKHKCSCDDESDNGKEKRQSPNNVTLKELAKHKRRMRKESKLRKLSDSNSESNSEEHKVHSSIPILQASRFDRLRAIGCYRNQTYLTLPASRVDTKTPFMHDNVQIMPEYKKTNTMGTQTDDVFCDCGSQVTLKCANCDANVKMVRSEANYNLASMTDATDVDVKKLNCDTNNSFNKNFLLCDKVSFSNVKNVRKYQDDDAETNIVKRPKLKRLFPIVDKLERIVTDRFINNNINNSKIDNNNSSNDMEELFLKNDDTVFAKPNATTRIEREKHPSISEDYLVYEKCCYANYDRVDALSPKSDASSPKSDAPSPNCDSKVNFNGFVYPESPVSSVIDAESINRMVDSTNSMFNAKTGLPLTSSPAPSKRGSNRFDYDATLNGATAIKSALFPSPPGSPRPTVKGLQGTRRYKRSGLLGSWEECLLKSRLPLSPVSGFSCKLAAAGGFCTKQLRLPAHVAFVDTPTATYRSHIDLPQSYHVPPSGTIQVSLFNPHGTLVKMFVVLYDLSSMPASSKTFLRQRTLYLPAGCEQPTVDCVRKYLRYLIHLRFMTSKSGKLYLHSDIKMLVSKRADMDTATAHSAAIFKQPANRSPTSNDTTTNHMTDNEQTANSKPCRVFGGCGTIKDNNNMELCYENRNNVAYELRSFTYGPENPKYSPR